MAKEFFLNGEELLLNSVISVNSENLINHQSMDIAQFEDPVCHMCLAGVMVVSWSPTQVVAGLSHFNDKLFLSLNLLN